MATLLIPGTLRQVWAETAALDGGTSSTISTGIVVGSSPSGLARVLAVLRVTAITGLPDITATVASVNRCAAVTITNNALPGNTAIYTLDITKLQSIQQGIGGAFGVVHVVGGDNAQVASLVKVGTWTQVGSLATARDQANLVLLANGKALMIGGQGGGAIITLSSCELFDPVTNLWSATGDLIIPHQLTSAFRLANGKALILGGFSAGAPTDAVEAYDPTAGTWANAGVLGTPRGTALMVKLPPTAASPLGLILVAGGLNGAFTRVATAELYNPATSTSAPTGAMAVTRANGVAVFIPPNAAHAQGSVLVVGGHEGDNRAELYDVGAGTFALLASTPSVDAKEQRVTLLPDGRALIVGGISAFMGQIACDFYDPNTEVFTPAPSLHTPRFAHCQELLRDGRVLVASGGVDLINHIFTDTAEIYDSLTDTWTVLKSLHEPRVDGMSCLLADGRMLVAGGERLNNVETAEAETL